MAATRRESSADSAARFFVASDKRRRKWRKAQTIERRLSRYPAAPPPQPRGPRRIACDFAEPTLRLIHDVLLDAMYSTIDFGNRHALLMIAEQMVACALGEPPCDDPPLTDRNL